MVEAKYATRFPPQVLQDNEQITRTSQKKKIIIIIVIIIII